MEERRRPEYVKALPPSSVLVSHSSSVLRPVGKKKNSPSHARRAQFVEFREAENIFHLPVHFKGDLGSDKKGMLDL